MTRVPRRSDFPTLAAAFSLLSMLSVPFPASAAASPQGQEDPDAERSAPKAQTPEVLGLDHVILATPDVDAAARTFGRLGFALKSGRPHDNGITNRHVKFTDGTEIELLGVVGQPGDALASEYSRVLDGGPGAAFVGLFAPDLAAVQRRLSRNGIPTDLEGGLLTFPRGHPLRHVFFGRRNASPTDKPEHFAHENGAIRLLAVHLLGGPGAEEEALLRALGLSVYPLTAETLPSGAKWDPRQRVATLPEGDTTFGIRRYLGGAERPIVGASVEVRDIDATARFLTERGFALGRMVTRPNRRSVTLGELGFWLEFVEVD